MKLGLCGCSDCMFEHVGTSLTPIAFLFIVIPTAELGVKIDAAVNFGIYEKKKKARLRERICHLMFSFF